MKKIFFISFWVIMLSGCEDKYTYVTIPSYVTTYFDYDDLQLRVTADNNIAIEISGVKSIHKWSSINIDETYMSLCLKHNDVSYNKKVWQDIPDYIDIVHQYASPANDIISINVYSNQDFDSEHPAGSSLNDKILLLSCSPKLYIESSYTNEYNWVFALSEDSMSIPNIITPEEFLFESEISRRSPVAYIPEDSSTYYSLNYIFGNGTFQGERHPLIGLLSEVKDFELMGFGMSSKVFYYPATHILTNYCNTLTYLHFTEVPSLSQTHDLTITITRDDGRVFEKHITKTW